MKYLCLISHEQPGDEPGKFTRYEAGKEYDLDDPEPGLFRAVHGLTEEVKGTASLAKLAKGAKENLKEKH